MARPLIDRQLTKIRRGRFQFAVASREDDADIRRLLRESPMAGTVSLTFERDPDYFADTINPFETKQTIVAHAQGTLVCVGSCTIRRRFIHGKETQVGYLGGLRLAASHAGRTEILRAGYEFFYQLQRESPAEYYFTSIASDNLRARRMLERGLPGLPVYQFIGELVTLMISAKPSPRNLNNLEATQRDMVGWSERLNQSNRNYQLAPVWSVAELQRLADLGLPARCFFQCGSASACLWDQSSFKQTVIRGYTPMLAGIRPGLNLWAKLTGGIHFPAINQCLRNAYVSHLVSGTSEKDFLELLSRLQLMAGAIGIESMTIAFSSDDARLRVVQGHFRSHAFRSRIYLVHWPDCGHAADDWQHRPLAPEVALL